MYYHWLEGLLCSSEGMQHPHITVELNAGGLLVKKTCCRCEGEGNVNKLDNRQVNHHDMYCDHQEKEEGLLHFFLSLNQLFVRPLLAEFSTPCALE